MGGCVSVCVFKIRVWCVGSRIGSNYIHLYLDSSTNFHVLVLVLKMLLVLILILRHKVLEYYQVHSILVSLWGSATHFYA